MIGLGVYDCLARDIVDPDTGEIYEALSCCNNPEMASRCTVVGAPKVIWSIKASAAFNSDAAYMLREGFRSGRIRLLQKEDDGEKNLREIRGYSTLSQEEQMKLQMPYVQTTLLIDELTKLKHEENGGKIKLVERSNMRKDRYSSLAYNYYVAVQIENKMTRRHNLNADNVADTFIIKPPKSNIKRKAVNLYGSNKNHGRY